MIGNKTRNDVTDIEALKQEVNISGIGESIMPKTPVSVAPVLD